MTEIELEINNLRTGARQLRRLGPGSYRIGRGRDNEVPLHSPFVSDVQCVLEVVAAEVRLRNVGSAPVFVGDAELPRHQVARVPAGAEVRIADQSLRYRSAQGADEIRPTAVWDQARVRVVATIHADLIARLERLGAAGGRSTPEGRENVHRQMQAAVEEGLRAMEPGVQRALCCAGLAARAERECLGEGHYDAAAESPFVVAALEQEIDVLVRRMLAGAGVYRGAAAGAAAAPAQLGDAVPALAATLDSSLATYTIRQLLLAELHALVFGFGPLDALLRRRDVTEIMVVGKDRIFLERAGRLESSGERFLSLEHLLDVIQRMVAPLGRRIDRSSPMVDGRLPSGARVNAVIAPVAINGPHLTIRKFPERALTLDDLVANGSLDARVGAFLCACVRGRKNLLIAGGTGSGKTTLLNVLAGFIGPRERIVTVEDAAELRLPHEHVASLESRPANVEGRGELVIRDLVRNALRMRPDRIIVGECRGAEALDMLQAMNTGHAGSMTTVHANSAHDALRRVESMVLTAQNMPLAPVRLQIASAIDLVVQIARTRSGRRRVVEIAEVTGYDEHAGDIEVAPLFTLRGDDDGRLLASTGTLASFLPELVQRGLLTMEQML